MTLSIRKITVWIVAGLVLALVAAGVGIGAGGMISWETAHARQLVENGRGALVANDRARAVLAFERARLFAPRSEMVRAALEAADVRDPESLAPRLLRLVTPTEWCGLATVCGWVSGLGLALIIARKRGGLLAPVVIASTVALVVGVTALELSSRAKVSVITRGGTDALVAPYAAAAVQGPLPAGSVVLRAGAYGSFAHVRTSEGVEGWVPSSHLEPVVAATD